jgi:hypothetical protein
MLGESDGGTQPPSGRQIIRLLTLLLVCTNPLLLCRHYFLVIDSWLTGLGRVDARSDCTFQVRHSQCTVTAATELPMGLSDFSGCKSPPPPVYMCH